VNTQAIRFDYNNALADVVGEHGLTEAEIEAALPHAAAAIEAVQNRRAELGWPDLPYQDTSEIIALAQEVRARADTLVVLGIGGSALGPIATQTALQHPFYNNLPRELRRGPTLFVPDNADPELNAGLLDVLDLEQTVFNVITKSGTTAETMAAFLYFREALANRIGTARLRDHLVLTTDPKKGALRQIVEREGYPSLPLPSNVGGRFSELTAVGLFPAAVTGVDIGELLAGAAFADKRCQERDPRKNPAAMNALIQFLLDKKGKNMVVMMPYAQRLKDVADWFRQLWAESLGKHVDRAGNVVNVGPTPIKSLGVTDQHSQVQLYAEGPFDKVFNFLFVDAYQTNAPLSNPYPDIDELAYLDGKSFDALIKAEAEATQLALTEAGRPNVAHYFPTVNAFTLGQFYYMLEQQTAIAGELYNINAFDQPGVEAGKVATYALMGRTGYDQRRHEIEESRGKRRDDFVI
jgi:glucose-6-phosphate isomerase